MAADDLADSSATETGWDRRRRRIAEELESVAVDLFAERGFSSVTLDEVAAAAGVSTRTVTRYFRAKEDLLLEMPRRANLAMADALAATVLSSEPVADLWQLWRDLTTMHTAGVEQFLVWQRAAITAPEVAARAMGEQSHVLVPMLAERFAEALGLSLTDDVRPSTLAAAVAAANAAVIQFWLLRGGTEALEDLFVRALEGLSAQFSSPAVKRQLRRASGPRPAARPA